VRDSTFIVSDSHLLQLPRLVETGQQAVITCRTTAQPVWYCCIDIHFLGLLSASQRAVHHINLIRPVRDRRPTAEVQRKALPQPALNTVRVVSSVVRCTDAGVELNGGKWHAVECARTLLPASGLKSSVLKSLCFLRVSSEWCS
jgi:hypothetical protein